MEMRFLTACPYSFTGYLDMRERTPKLLANPFVPVVQGFTQRSSVRIEASGCTGLCSAKVVGAGLASNCLTSEQPFYLPRTFPDGVSEEDHKLAQKITKGTNIFGTYFLWSGATHDGGGGPARDMDAWPMMTFRAFNLGLQYKGTGQCNGALVRSCTFRPATVEYPVSIDGISSSISLAAGTTVVDDKFQNFTGVSTWESWIPSVGLEPSTYGGLFRSLSDTYGSVLRMRFTGHHHRISHEGALSIRYLNGSQLWTPRDPAGAEETERQICWVQFHDPITKDNIDRPSEYLTSTSVKCSQSGVRIPYLLR